MPLPMLGTSKTFNQANCDLDAMALAIAAADGTAGQAAADAAAAIASASAASAAATAASAAAANALATAVQASTDANAAANAVVALGVELDAVEVIATQGANAMATATQAAVDAAAASAAAAAAQATADAALLLAEQALAVAEGGGGGGGGGATGSIRVFDITDAAYGAIGDGITDCTAAINAASAACDAAGGGYLYIPNGRFWIEGDVKVSRVVNVIGNGTGSSFLVGNDPGRALEVIGAKPNGCHIMRDISLDSVGVVYGRTPSDFGRACRLQRIEIQNATTGVYYGYNCYIQDIDQSFIHSCTQAVHYDLTTPGVGAGSGSNQTIRASILVDNDVGILVTGNTADGHHITAFGTNLEHNHTCLKTVATSDGMIMLRDCHFELVHGYFVDNDGANVFVDGFLGASIIELAWFKQSAGNIFVSNGRGSWLINKFAHLTGGNLFIDNGSIFCASRWFGEAVVQVPVGATQPGFGAAIPALTAGSSGGKLMLYGPTQFRAQTNVALTPITNLAKGPVAGAIMYRGDANNRVYDFTVELSNIGSDAVLRLDMANGLDISARIDMGFPLFAGSGKFTITYTPGVGGVVGQFQVTGIFVETVSGKAKVFNQTANETAGRYYANRTLYFTSEKFGATASTFTITQLNETVSGPTIVGI